MLAKLLFAAQAACCNRAEKKGDEKAKEKNNRQKQIQRPGQMQRRKNMLCQVRKELSLLNAADQMSVSIPATERNQVKYLISDMYNPYIAYALPNTDGKISAAQIEACAAEYYDNAKPEYLTEPKMVYLEHEVELSDICKIVLAA